ncbi:hypothetical protein SAMN05216551_1097 [Chitinasiproducens palmae]|uniref:Uncharacterized protein n=1 Tax=Chitinasiproducens palmae TaxID=1770053 RepID=A0A1H2PSN9_9BURK|nr:hypothetical protein SAMN05216551_1097 [Chitinasiproducens palmae]
MPARASNVGRRNSPHAGVASNDPEMWRRRYRHGGGGIGGAGTGSTGIGGVARWAASAMTVALGPVGSVRPTVLTAYSRQLCLQPASVARAPQACFANAASPRSRRPAFAAPLARACARVRVCACARVHVCASARLHVCTSARLHVCTSARLHVCTSARQLYPNRRTADTRHAQIQLANGRAWGHGVGARRLSAAALTEVW